MAQTLVLAKGELHHQRRFGPDTVNRGAVLLDCEWDGGVFESGALVSGVFRSGEIRGGSVLGALFWDGTWTGGSWERGFDRQGRYRPRTDRPPHEEPGPRTAAPPPSASGRDLTVFTSTVYADVARLWYACVQRSFPEAKVEIFWDSEQPVPDASLFPGATFIRRAPERRDYHEAYDDALARCATPYLAFTDTDVFWTCRDFWPRLRDELERDDRLAAVSCISRSDRPSHGTFAVILKPGIYRGVRASFASAIENVDPAIPWQRWTHHSSGDLAARAVLDAGYGMKLLHLDREGQDLVRFDGITAPRRIGEHLPAARLPRLIAAGRYHWAGLLGNRVLAGLHDRLFAVPYGMTVPAAALLREALRRSPREVARRLRLFVRCRSGAQRVERFLREPA
jgi:hypothetical protein